jgi:eukaryotic-like serine/threonine-protein kinase
MSAVQGPLKEGLIAGFRYQIEDLLGVGENGDVYACLDLSGDKTALAIKILSPISDSSEITESLSRELALMQRLRHPNLVRIFDSGIMENSRELFLIEERVSGMDLYAGTAGMGPEEILWFCVQVLNGLQYLHARRIVHGNLKPSNVLLSGTDEEGRRPKLLDFDLQFRCNHFRQQDGFKTVSYTAPEILLGNPPEKASDIYAVGILIYQLLVRRLPFEDEDRGFLIQKQLQGDIDMNPLKRLKCCMPMTRLLQRILDKDPVKRIGLAGEVMDVLNAEILQDFHKKDAPERESRFGAAQFVGREMEMQMLRNRARHIKETGRGRTVFLTGEAGSGKTR